MGILLSVLLHAFVGLKRTYDMKLTMGLRSGALNLAVSGLMLLTFMTIQLFQFRIWSGFYIFCVVIFMVHACLGWKKVVPVLGIPKLHVTNVEKFGYAIFFAIGFIYISFPLFVMFSPPFAGHEKDLQYVGRVGA